MANWAIVIGINKYDWKTSAWLKGAINDALEVTKWLLDATGGNVPSNNLYLLLSASDEDVIPKDLGVYIYSARKEDIVNVIVDLVRSVNKSVENGDRLFFYFAGHGLGAAFGKDQALIPSDFIHADPTRSISLETILEYLRFSNFKEQFFFLDSCRNLPWDDFEMGKMLKPPRENMTFPQVNQFVIKATSHGVKAAEIQYASKANGIFTKILLNGLTKGIGESKILDTSNQIYLVTFYRLFNYIKNELKKFLSTGMNPTIGKLLQEPKIDGERGDGNDPVLARFNNFPNEKLEILLEPKQQISQMQIVIYIGRFPYKEKSQITTLPVIFDLEPQTYTIEAILSGYTPKRKNIDLYTPKTETIIFTQL